MQKIVFETREGDTFRLPLKLVKHMKTVCDMVDFTSDEDKPQDPMPIVLKNIRTETFKYILHWAMYNSMNDKTEDIEEESDQIKDEKENSALILMVTDIERLPNEMAKMDPWIKKFLSAIPLPDLCQVLAAADYLNMHLLEQQACVFLANQIQGKTTRELREFLGVKNDFTVKQKREMKENEPIWEQ